MQGRRASRGSNYRVAIGLAFFTAAAAAYPLIYTLNGPQLLGSDKGLSPDSIIRGAYVNTGSKDAGRDPAYGLMPQRPKGGS